MSTPFFSKRLDPSQRARLLEGIIDRVRAARRPHTPAPVAIFDLDGTLMDNRPRVVAIIRELGATWERVHPEAAAACARANPDDIVYGFIDNLKHLGVVDPALHEEGLAFWKHRFFTDAHQRFDVEVIGAREYVRAIHDAGAIVVYLTGRDLPGMSLGSFAELARSRISGSACSARRAGGQADVRDAGRRVQARGGAADRAARGARRRVRQRAGQREFVSRVAPGVHGRVPRHPVRAEPDPASIARVEVIESFARRSS